jgi:ParG
LLIGALRSVRAADEAPDLHTRLKVECSRRGLKIADVVRDLLEREFPQS